MSPSSAEVSLCRKETGERERRVRGGQWDRICGRICGLLVAAEPSDDLDDFQWLFKDLNIEG